MLVVRLFGLLAVLAVAGCGDDTELVREPTVARSVFEPTADLTDSDRFYDMPWPSDLRLTARGTPNVEGFPKSEQGSILFGLLEVAGERPGWPTNPVAYFQFSHDVGTKLDIGTVHTTLDAPLVLIDVDPDSPSRGEVIPCVAEPLGEDLYVRAPMLAVAARPGFILWADRTYAFVVRKSLGEHSDLPVESAPAFEALKPGGAGSSDPGVAALYEPLWQTLDEVGVDSADVVAATVFTTGDVVRQTHEMSNGVLAQHSVTIDELALDPADGTQHERYCELHATVRYPQFQKGTVPFEVDGNLVLDDAGVPVKQGEIEAPVVIAIPKGEMPPDGYPLNLYLHGSGGFSYTVVDRGSAPDVEAPGKGPAHELAAFGIASAGSALPANPERLKGAGELAYLNFDNPKAMPSTFRQGVFEQRLFLRALLELSIDPAVLAGCDGPTLPAGETAFRFSDQRVTAMGQSMGGMYTNMLGATEPLIQAAVPTGAGGYWSVMVFDTTLVPGAGALLGLLIDTKQTLGFTHPSFGILEMAFEPAEPMVYMPRLARRPLDGHPTRSVFDPVGIEDTYFATIVYDAAALAYGHQQAGEEVWPTMQDALALAGLDGVVSFPVKQNLTSEIGDTPFTGVIAQYPIDGISDGHYVAFEIEAVKHQYGCFLSSFVETGVATVPPPNAPGSPCE